MKRKNWPSEIFTKHKKEDSRESSGTCMYPRTRSIGPQPRRNKKQETRGLKGLSSFFQKISPSLYQQQLARHFESRIIIKRGRGKGSSPAFLNSGQASSGLLARREHIAQYTCGAAIEQREHKRGGVLESRSGRRGKKPRTSSSASAPLAAGPYLPHSPRTFLSFN